MALSGLQIFKHLPKTNCKECGVPTCLAFAMKVASGQSGLDKCPHMTEEGKAALSEASAPPQQLVTIGTGEAKLEIGQETVLFRHEERFHRPAGVAVRNDSGDGGTFTEAAKKAAGASGKPVALLSSNAENLRAAGEALKDKRPLLWATGGAAEAAIPVAKDLGLPLCLEADGFEALAALSEKAKAAGLGDIVLSPGEVEAAKGLEFLSQSRRAAIQKKFRPMGYPVAMLALAGDETRAVIDACWYILKYAGLVVVDLERPEQLLGVLTSRQDIYTDPQVPVQVEAGLHKIGEPGNDAPVLVTTNFALSYYSVEGEVESSRVAAYILSVATEGTSVLTAWAADKFNPTTITETMKAADLESKVTHRKVVIPGLVAVLSAGIKDESGWDVVIGPKEASGIVSYLKNQWKP